MDDLHVVAIMVAVVSSGRWRLSVRRRPRLDLRGGLSVRLSEPIQPYQCHLSRCLRTRTLPQGIKDMHTGVQKDVCTRSDFLQLYTTLRYALLLSYLYAHFRYPHARRDLNAHSVLNVPSSNSTFPTLHISRSSSLSSSDRPSPP